MKTVTKRALPKINRCSCGGDCARCLGKCNCTICYHKGERP